MSFKQPIYCWNNILLEWNTCYCSWGLRNKPSLQTLCSCSLDKATIVGMVEWSSSAFWSTGSRCSPLNWLHCWIGSVHLGCSCPVSTASGKPFIEASKWAVGPNLIEESIWESNHWLCLSDPEIEEGKAIEGPVPYANARQLGPTSG